MIKTFYLGNEKAFKPGQIISAYDTMPDKKQTERYKVIKLMHYSKTNQVGEFKVQPIDVSKDPGNLTDGHGHPSKGLR